MLPIWPSHPRFSRLTDLPDEKMHAGIIGSLGREGQPPAILMVALPWLSVCIGFLLSFPQSAYPIRNTVIASDWVGFSCCFRIAWWACTYQTGSVV